MTSLLFGFRKDQANLEKWPDVAKFDYLSLTDLDRLAFGRSVLGHTSNVLLHCRGRCHAIEQLLLLTITFDNFTARLKLLKQFTKKYCVKFAL